MYVNKSRQRSGYISRKTWEISRFCRVSCVRLTCQNCGRFLRGQSYLTNGATDVVSKNEHVIFSNKFTK